MAQIQKTHLIIFIGLTIVALTCALLPSLDLAVASLFYQDGERFFLRNHIIARFFYRSVPVLTITWVLILLFLLWKPVYQWRSFSWNFPRRQNGFLWLSAILGPGIIVNSILKEFWGRARPSQIVEFGGTKTFTPALQPAAECAQNCSFVSGHSGMAFYFLIPFFLGGRYRWHWLCGGFAFGLMVGATRIVQGGHFLSDVMGSAWVVYTTGWVCHTLLIKPNKNA